MPVQLIIRIRDKILLTSPENELIVMQNFRYNLLSFLSFAISFMGWIGIKICIIAVTVGTALLTERYIGSFGLSIGWVIGMFVGALLFYRLERLSPLLDRLDNSAKALKKYPYTEKYGIDFPKPASDDFKITQAEFKDYNKRFQFEYIKLFFTYGLWIASCIFILQKKTYGFFSILIAGRAGALAIIFNYLFEYWNRRISQAHPNYQKIHAYQKALKIYYEIREENAKI